LALIREEREGAQQRQAAAEPCFADLSTQSLTTLGGPAPGQTQRLLRIGRVVRFTRPIQYRRGEHGV
jgi:hypothetical protein